MAQAPRDENRTPVLLGVLNTDGVTPVPICTDALSLHFMCISAGTDGTDFGPDTAARDENRVPVAMAVSSVDGVTPVPLYANSSGELLIKTS